MYKVQIFYQIMITLLISFVLFSFFLLLGTFENESNKTIVDMFIGFFILYFFYRIMREYRIFKVKNGRIVSIKTGCISKKEYDIKNIVIEKRQSPILGKVYFFSIQNYGISINEKMYSKRSFRVIEHYIQKHNEIVDNLLSVQTKNFHFQSDSSNPIIIDKKKCSADKLIKEDINGIIWLEPTKDYISGIKKMSILLSVTILIFNIFFIFLSYKMNIVFEVLVFVVMPILLAYMLVLIRSYSLIHTKLGIKNFQILYIKNIFGSSSDILKNIYQVSDTLIIKNKKIQYKRSGFFDKDQYKTYLEPILPYITINKNTLDDKIEQQFIKLTKLF